MSETTEKETGQHTDGGTEGEHVASFDGASSSPGSAVAEARYLSEVNDEDDCHLRFLYGRGGVSGAESNTYGYP